MSLKKLCNLLSFVIGFPNSYKILKSNIDLFLYRQNKAVGIKAQLLALSDGHVLVRKVRKFELPSTNIF